MSRPRLTQAQAEISGEAARRPARFEKRAEPKVEPLGSAPSRFTERQKAIWQEFADDLPWLGRSDRRAVEIGVLLQERIAHDPDVPVAVFAQMRLLLGAMGATPTDRTKVDASQDEPTDPADAYFN